MKKLILLIFTLMLFYSCENTKKAINQSVYIENMNQNILLGAINKTGLKKEPYASWFNTNYTDYKIKTNILEQLKAEMIEGISIKLILATWCGDSKREVPHFYKIMEALNYPCKNIEAIAVDRSKKAPNYNLEAINITRVPTFIFYKDNKEIGRITERPKKSLEEDLFEILTSPNL